MLLLQVNANEGAVTEIRHVGRLLYLLIVASLLSVVLFDVVVVVYFIDR